LRRGLRRLQECIKAIETAEWGEAGLGGGVIERTEGVDDRFPTDGVVVAQKGPGVVESRSTGSTGLHGQAVELLCK